MNPAQPDARPDRDEAVGLPVERAHLLHAPAAVQRSVEWVGPGVIGADDGAAVAGVVEQPGAPMPAGVRERPNLAVFAARHDRRPAAQVEHAVVARARDLVDPADEIPALDEDLVDFAPVERIGGVASGWQRLRVEQGAPDAFVAAWVEEVAHRSGSISRVRAGIVQKRRVTVKRAPGAIREKSRRASATTVPRPVAGAHGIARRSCDPLLQAPPSPKRKTVNLGETDRD